MTHFPVQRALFVGALIMVFSAPVPVVAEELSRIPVPRNESLELPGLTAGCHVCEWRPKLNQMPAPEQCGTEDSGAARIGLFECGFSQECARECHFLRCGTQTE